MKIFNKKFVSLMAFIAIVVASGNIRGMEELDDPTKELSELIGTGKETSKKIRELIKKGAKRNDPSGYSAGGHSALTLALFYNAKKNIIEALLEDGPDLKEDGITIADLINTGDENGHTAMHYAIGARYGIKRRSRQEIEDILTVLLKKGGNINIQGHHGFTPLHSAVWHRDTDKVRFLLQQGASTTLTNDENETPLDMLVQKPDALPALTGVSQEDIQHIIPGVMAARQKVGKDVSGLIARELVQSVINEKLIEIIELAKGSKKFMQSYPEPELEKLIKANVKKALQEYKYPRVQEQGYPQVWWQGIIDALIIDLGFGA